MKHVAKFLLVAKAPREAFTIGFSERADQRVAVLTTDLSAHVVLSRIKGHF
jgi:hypothetical protein